MYDIPILAFTLKNKKTKITCRHKQFWVIKKARDGIRTRGPRLGKAMLHH